MTEKCKCKGKNCEEKNWKQKKGEKRQRKIGIKNVRTNEYINRKKSKKFKL